MFTRRATLAFAAAATLAGPALAQDPIVVGEINSYTRMAAFTDPYKKGWELALDEINSAGGVRDGRPIEVIWRDDAASPGDAVKIAEELVSRENVTLLFGTFLSNIGLAVSDFANQRQVLFIAAEPLADAVTWAKGNRYTYRLRPNTTMQAAMLADEAAKTGAKKWATVAPNYAYGQEAVEAFKRELLERVPDAEFVEEQWPVLFKIDAGPVVRALEASKPEGIFNVTFGSDLAKFVREGSIRGLFDGREVVSLLSGEPEYLDPLGAEAPEGWLVTGYPPYDIDEPAHNAFRDAYVAAWDEMPKVGSIVGYNAMKAVAAVLDKAESLETEDLLAAMEDLTFDTP
jgi:branched-chain amino acid transport system substrate-binding protein